MNTNKPEHPESEDELDVELIDVEELDLTEEPDFAKELDFAEERPRLTDREASFPGPTGARERRRREFHKRRKKEAALRELLSYVQIFLLALVLTYFISFHIIVNATIPSGSMSNTILTGDRVIGLRLAYLFSPPQRGDIVIFKFPDNEEEDYIKRIIGVGGDTVEIVNGQVFVNGILLIEDYIAEPMAENLQPLSYEVPQDCYFVMGDNRNHSHDSRYWKNTYVSRNKIIGKAVLKYYKGFKFLQ